MVDERGKDLLPGDPGDPEAIGRFSLPNVQGPMGGRRQIDGAAYPPPARRREVGGPFGGRLAQAGEALGRCGVDGGRGGWRGSAERSPTGSDLASVEVHCDDVLRLVADQEISAYRRQSLLIVAPMAA